MNLFKEEDFAGTSGDESFVVEQVHLAEIIVVNFLESVIGQIILVSVEISLIKNDREPFSLAIECVNLMIVVIIEGLVREVLFGASLAKLMSLNF